MNLLAFQQIHKEMLSLWPMSADYTPMTRREEALVKSFAHNLDVNNEVIKHYVDARTKRLEEELPRVWP